MRIVRWVETQRQLWAEQRLNAAQLRYMTLLGEICRCRAVARIIMPGGLKTFSRPFRVDAVSLDIHSRRAGPIS